MASTSSLSEKEFLNSVDNAELPLEDNQEYTHVNEWVDVTINDEIARGAKLRTEYKRQYKKIQKNCNVVDVNNKKSPCSDSDESSRHRKRGRRIKTCPNNSCSPCRHTQRTRNVSSSSPSSRSRSRARRCPLRIAELAAPSKRHCIETWRNKAETLPIFMVQRLRKYVMDESPIVQVSDAVTCFQRKRSSKKKKVCKNRSKVCLASLKTAQDMMETRNLCAIFGHKLAKKLILPMNITLDSDWQRVSDVVSAEITNLLKGKTRLLGDNSFNRGIHEEISNKVAVWIATIIEDTSYKLLEEDLRAQKNKERRLGKDEKLVTLIENHLLSCHRDASELEEEEGPALDFIDDLVHNVMKVCIISSASESDSNSGSDSEQLPHSNEDDGSEKKSDETSADRHSGTENSSESMRSAEPEPMSDQSIAFNDQTVQEIVNDLVNDMIVPENSNKSDEGNYTANSMGQVNTVKSILDFESDPLISGVRFPTKDAEFNSDEMNPVHNNTELEGQLEDIDLVNTVIDHQDNVKVSEVLPGEGPLDDKYKKVTFSQLNMANRGELIENNSRKHSLLDNKNNLFHNLSWIMTFADKPDILIAPPNDHLLSEADESWPEDITTPMLRVSESVSRSITSLGKIIETEEKASNSQDDENIKQRALKVRSQIEQSEGEVSNSQPENDLKLHAQNVRNLIEKIEEKVTYYDENVKQQAQIVSNSVENNYDKLSDSQDDEMVKEKAEVLDEQIVKTVGLDHYTDNGTARWILDNYASSIAIEDRGHNPQDKVEDVPMDNVSVVVNAWTIKALDKVDSTIALDLKDIPKSGGDAIIDDHQHYEGYRPNGFYENTADIDDGESSDISSTEPPQMIKVEIQKVKPKVIPENEIPSGDDKKEETKIVSATTPDQISEKKDVGKGDHNDDVKSEKNLILEAVQQIIKLPYVDTKFDYRVDPTSAPAWAICSQPSEDSLLEFSKIQMKHTLKESEVRKWCKDLEQSYINLEQWNNWVENTCNQIIFYKQRGEVNKVFAPNTRKNEGRHWVKLKRTVDRDAVLWTKLNQRTQEVLKKYRFSHKSAMRVNKEVNEILVKRNHSSEESILRAFDEIDRHSIWMHRLIVSTEYCVKCKCKNFTRKASTQRKN